MALCLCRHRRRAHGSVGAARAVCLVDGCACVRFILAAPEACSRPYSPRPLLLALNFAVSWGPLALTLANAIGLLYLWGLPCRR